MIILGTHERRFSSLVFDTVARPRCISICLAVSRVVDGEAKTDTLRQVASVDPHQQISYRGQELYKKRSADVNLEDTAAVRTLMEMFLGTQGTALPPESRVVAAALPLKVKLMNMFCKSEAAANAFPSAVQAVFACLYGVPTNMSLKQAGMSFAVWMFQKAKDDRLAPMGPIILGGLLKLLDEGEAAAAEGDQQLRSLRSFTYQVRTLLVRHGTLQHVKKNWLC